MKTWKDKVVIKNIEYDVVEHTDKECSVNRDLAPRSHGFVNLYQDGKFHSWRGVTYAIRHKKNKTPLSKTKVKRLKKYIKNGGIDDILSNMCSSDFTEDYYLEDAYMELKRTKEELNRYIEKVNLARLKFTKQLKKYKVL